ncbi:endo-b1,4-mannanase 5C [Klebsiella pneumoniae subsp. ozaenae]|uniref:Endo-b1,4-mannanase 5C n=1 Tax=Klebsiella pneumoniae subsp. ozaenae TaxID=574 RepID=A0A377Z9U0_KLEPO|nr:endo-b1,4-mannanase 5C [Klebsiella pneumoniae subsp. ozaenae]
MPIGLKPGAWFTAPGTYALTFTADDGLLKSSKTVTVTVGEAAGRAPADFCRYHGEVYGVAEGRLTVMKSDKDALAVGEDGFLGPFANEGDKVSWQVQAPWERSVPAQCNLQRQMGR